MRLHTVNKPAAESGALAACLRFAGPGDCLLLLEEGVYAACPESIEPLRESGCKLLVLESDADARGLLGRLDRSIELIDYAGFVELAARSDSVLSWY